MVVGKSENQVRDGVYKDAVLNSMEILPSIGFYLLGDPVIGRYEAKL